MYASIGIYGKVFVSNERDIPQAGHTTPAEASSKPETCAVVVIDNALHSTLS